MKRNLIVFLLALAMVSVAACGPADPTPAPDVTPVTPTDTDDGPHRGGALRIATPTSPVSPDPQLEQTNAKYASAMTDTLMLADADGVPQPFLARDYEVSEDGTVYTFYLQEGVIFHDGEPFNAEAAKFSIIRFLDPDLATRKEPALMKIADIEALDTYTLRITLDAPDALFLQAMSNPPLGMVSPKAVEELGDAFEEAPVGLGPYKYKSFIPDELTVLERFDDYWQGTPYMDEIHWVVIPELTTRVMELEMGNVDVLAFLDARNALALEEKGFVMIEDLRFANFWLAMNLEHPLLSDVRMRRAMCHALDRQLLIDEVTYGLADPGYAGIQPASWAFDPTVEVCSYDPEKAGELLDDMGWHLADDGFRYNDEGTRLHFEWSAANRPDNLIPTEIAQQLFRDVGIDSSLTMGDHIWRLTSARTGDFEITMWGLSASINPVAQADRSHSEFYWNPNRHYIEEIDDLLERVALETDEAVIKEMLSEFQHLAAEHLPIVWLYHNSTITVLNPRVKDLFIDPSNYFDFSRTWLEQE